MNISINKFVGEYSFLSNFCKSEIWLGSRLYPSVEHFYQAGKAKTEPLHEYVRTAESPAEAKKRGREVAMRDDWKHIKLDYMKLGLVLKFDIEELGNLLLGTGEIHLEEGNTWGDTYWGTVDGFGSNNLGNLLMEVRSQILERRDRSTTTTTQQG